MLSLVIGVLSKQQAQLEWSHPQKLYLLDLYTKETDASCCAVLPAASPDFC